VEVLRITALNLQSGVVLSIVEEANRKLLRFDKPVQLVEIQTDEALELASSLIEGTYRPTITDTIRNLKRESFFSEPRNSKDVRNRLAQVGRPASASAVSTALTKMVRSFEIIRTGSPRSYQYLIKESRVE